MLTKQFFFLTVLFSVLGLAVSAQTSELDFSSTGTYGVGVQVITLVDADRDNRELPVSVWYPVEPPSRRRAVLIPKTDAAILETDAPYPLVIFSVGACLDEQDTQGISIHLASYGFVVISAQHAPVPGDWADLTDNCEEDHLSIVQRPLDIRLMLDRIEAGTFSAFDALIDLERVGVTGLSYGAYTALVAAGAEVNANALAAYCSNRSSDRLCGRMLSDWNNIKSLYEALGTTDANGNWLDLNDSRIDVAAAAGPCFMPLMGADGLANLRVPTLIFSVEGDLSCSPSRDASKVFENSSATENYWLNWTGEISEDWYDVRHMALMREDNVIDSVKALETAFFYTHLIEQAPFAPYLETLLQAPEDWDVQSNP